MENNEKMKAVMIRTSTEEQNPANQLRDIETLSGSDYLLFEEKISAWKDKERPIFEDLKKQIEQGKIKELYVWDLDRIYRNRIKIKGFIQFCKTYGCKLFSYRQKFLNQIQELNLPKEFEFLRDMMLNNLIEMLGWIAEDESSKKSHRVKIAVNRNSGVTLSYKGNKWGRRSLPESVIKSVLALHSEGKSIREITKLVFYWDKSNNKKYLSLGSVHKIVSTPHTGVEVVNNTFTNGSINERGQDGNKKIFT